jgi:stress-induced morphogen
MPEQAVHDFSDGCGAKFDLIVVTKEFEGKPLLDRHRLVNEALKDLMPKIHAVTMKTWTPTQWESKKPQA